MILKSKKGKVLVASLVVIASMVGCSFGGGKEEIRFN